MGLGDIESNEKQTAHERCRCRCRCRIAYYLVLITKLEFEPLFYMGEERKKLCIKQNKKATYRD